MTAVDRLPLWMVVVLLILIFPVIVVCYFIDEDFKGSFR